VAGVGAEALPDTGSGPDSNNHGTTAMLLALASGVAGAAIVTWAGRRKRTEQ
jgi:hypothetical protein